MNDIYVHFWLPINKKESLFFFVFPFLKSIVYSHVVLDKLEQSYKSFFPGKVKLAKVLMGIPIGKS